MNSTTTRKITVTISDLRDFIASHIRARVPPDATLWVCDNAGEQPKLVHELGDHDYIEVEWTEEWE